jgi:hypothetical protein
MESEAAMSDPHLDPAEALALAGRARRRTVQRGLVWWYYPVVGLIMAGMTASLALPNPVIGTTVGLMAVVATLTLWRKRTGLSRIRHTRRTLAVVIPLALLEGCGFLLAFELSDRGGLEWAPLAVAPVLGLIAGFGSWMVDRTWASGRVDV